MPPAGHDGDGRPCQPPLPGRQAHLPQSAAWPLHRPRDEPLHHLLPLRPLLSRLRRGHGSGCLRLPLPHVLRAPGGRRSGKRICRQPGGGLPHRRVHGQALQRHLHPQMGLAIRPLRMPRLRGGLQYPARRALRPAQAGSQPLPLGSEWLFPVRSRALRQRLRQQRGPPAPRWPQSRGWPVRGTATRRRNGPLGGGAERGRSAGHRFAPRLLGKQPGLEAAGGRGELLPRLLRPGSPAQRNHAGHLPGRRRPHPQSGRGGGIRCRAHSGRGCAEHRPSRGAGPAPNGAQPLLGHGVWRRHSPMAGRRGARPRPARQKPAVDRRPGPERLGRHRRRRLAGAAGVPCRRRVRHRPCHRRALCRAGREGRGRQWPAGLGCRLRFRSRGGLEPSAEAPDRLRRRQRFDGAASSRGQHRLGAPSSRQGLRPAADWRRGQQHGRGPAWRRAFPARRLGPAGQRRGVQLAGAGKRSVPPGRFRPARRGAGQGAQPGGAGCYGNAHRATGRSGSAGRQLRRKHGHLRQL